MSYYDEDLGYVGYDPYEEHDRRVHRERYHKSEVSTVQELLDEEYTNYFVEKSKEYIDEPEEVDSNDSAEECVNNFTKAFHARFGDIGKALKLMMNDRLENNGTVRIMETRREHIVNQCTKTYIVYEVGPNEVLGVFFDEETAVKFKESYR